MLAEYVFNLHRGGCGLDTCGEFVCSEIVRRFFLECFANRLFNIDSVLITKSVELVCSIFCPVEIDWHVFFMCFGE